MNNVEEHTKIYRDIVSRTFSGMFGVSTQSCSELRETNSVETGKSFIVSIHYTGTVFGEYLLALDEQTAAAILGIEDEIDDHNRDEIRDEICDAMTEALNTVVGEAIVELQNVYAKLTFSAPRVFFGQIRYPRFRTGSCSIATEAGEIECHFCLDLMRLNLAESYSEAMSSLMDVNRKLTDANRHLAEQQSQLVHSEKMASIGILAAGVAHEINTPLFVVEANLSTLDEYVSVMETTIDLYENLVNSLGSTKTDLAPKPDAAPPDDLDFVLDDTRNLLAESRESATRIKAIVRKLKDFSHIDRGGTVATDLNLVVENVITLMGEQLQSCQLELELGEVPEVDCNPGEISQVLINLLLNAVHACDGKQSTITLSTQYADDEVIVSVKDTGCGIRCEDLGHVFDPFFTTKDVGEGTGLGLSVSYGIIRKHDGAMTIESELDEGTLVTIRLAAKAVCC